MAGKSTLNARNLETLGASRLAELLMTVVQGNAEAKRILRLALAEQRGPAEMAREVRKRLASVARATSFLDGGRRNALLRDLEQQRGAISGPIADHDPALAVDLLWTFLDLAEAVIERCDDSDGAVMPLFHQASADLGVVAARLASPDPEVLADQVTAALIGNGYGQFDFLIRHTAAALGATGLHHLRRRMEALRVRPGTDEGRSITVRLAMLDIADALGDAEAYLAEYRDHDPEALEVPAIAAEVAERLTAAGRADEALSLLDGATPAPGRFAGRSEWLEARLTALELLGRSEEAQALRWAEVERSLSIRHLRDYLQRLPDFEDVEAEERALDLAFGYASLHQALGFLYRWPDRRRAARLILKRRGELDGDAYELLGPVAEALEAEQPLAATLCLRAMIDFSLERARSSRYRHAARHLDTCRILAAAIEDWCGLEDHASYLARLRVEHGRKYGFWGLVGEDPLPTDRVDPAEAQGSLML